jgi:hypothetical protein
MVAKHILCSDRLRRLPRQFSWIDHRFVRDKHICGITHPSLALYLFLVTVSDADGLSYYSDQAINRYLNLDAYHTAKARKELCTRGLIIYSPPLYQVLSLDTVAATPASVVRCDDVRTDVPISIGELLKQSLREVDND